MVVVVCVLVCGVDVVSMWMMWMQCRKVLGVPYLASARTALHWASIVVIILRKYYGMACLQALHTDIPIPIHTHT